MNPFILIRRDNDEFEVPDALQVDDALMLETDEFMELEVETAKQFKTKFRKTIGEEPVQFNGIHISIANISTIKINQPEKIYKFDIPVR